METKGPWADYSGAMKTLLRFISGIAASLLLAAGLHAAAGKLDPMTHDAGFNNPENGTTDQGKVSGQPCMPCNIDE